MSDPMRPHADSEAGRDRGGQVERIVFGTRNLEEIDSLVDHFCVRHLRAGVVAVLFRETSVGVVLGVLLDDGRRVVIKAHQPREGSTRLAAVHRIQRELRRAGLPCPQPLLGPVGLVNGFATVEALLNDGDFRDTHTPACRRLIAEALAWHLNITGARPAPEALNGAWSVFDGDPLWPAKAHAPIFDFNATSAGAEWIDALGREAKAAITAAGRSIAGRSDWSGKHFRFADDRITAIYDWDSLANRPETAIVGVAAMTYTTRFDLPGIARAPTPDEMNSFIDEYSAARHIPLTRLQRTQIGAHGLLIAAYTARCEHCALDGYDADADPTSFTAALRVHGDRYLQI